MEDRSNRVYGCPCEWSNEFSSDGREAVLAWKINSGEYEGHDLADLQLAAVSAGDFTLSAPTSARRSTVFVDASAPAAQRLAGVGWLRSHYSQVLGHVLGMHEVAIWFRLDAASAILVIGDVLDVRMRRANIAKDTQSWASLLYDPLTKLTSSTPRNHAPHAVWWRRPSVALVPAGRGHHRLLRDVLAEVAHQDRALRQLNSLCLPREEQNQHSQDVNERYGTRCAGKAS